MQQPNFLVLDEPTNDLDIVTLNVLEEYLADFRGTLIIVSHDRHFLDRLVDHLFILSPGGKVKDFVGSYSQWREDTLSREAAERSRMRQETERAEPSRPARAVPERDSGPRKLSYKETRELAALEAEIAALGAEKQTLEALLSGGTDDYARLQEATERFAQVSALLDEKETRWLELSI
jgi:ATP-binding cassette subfamily F protein uup